MKLSVLTTPLQGAPAAEAFAYLHSLGLEQVELGAGGYNGDSHLPVAQHVDHPDRIAAFQELLAKNGLEISALSCHGNPVHPDAARAARDHQTFVDACRLAQQMGVDTVVTFSGCPGDGPDAKNPNWVTCAWPPEYGETLAWQWDEVLIPYWKKAVAIANSYGIHRVALELHPGFCVYNPASLLRLRAAVGDTIGANFDPSHLFWQGIDPIAAVKALKGAIYHVHAKDTRIDPYNAAVDGVLDTQSFENLGERSWVFRTVGYGHDERFWRDFLSALRQAGYDGAISIEHEDGLMSPREGLEKAVAFLKPLLLREQPGAMWWS